MVSFDVVSLLTSVPLDKVLCIILEKLLSFKSLSDRAKLTVDDIIKCLHLCFDSIVFTYKNVLYCQVFGTPIGLCISLVVANIFMKDFEDYTITSNSSPALIWIRYVDNTFCILDLDLFLTFLDHLSSICPSIIFTLKKEKLNRLSFLL